MSIVDELFKDRPERLQNFQNTYFEEFFKRPSVLQCLKQLRRTVAVSEKHERLVFGDTFLDSFGENQHVLVTFYVNSDRNYTLVIDLISEDYYDYGKYERNGNREKGFEFNFSDVTKNLQVHVVNHVTFYGRREIFQILEGLFS